MAPSSAPAAEAVAGLRVIGDPVRWELLEHLAASDLRVGELVERTGRAQNLVSYHLGELRRWGLVASRRSAADGRDSYYRVHLDRFGQLLGAAATALDSGLAITRSPVETRSPGGRRPTVLFLCTGNSARSQIAEALTRHRSQGTVGAWSAGSHPKPVHPAAVRVLADRGIDLGDAGSKGLDAVANVRFDRVITLCDKVREVCPELPGGPRAAHWSIPDPAVAPDPDAFEAVAADLDRRIEHLLADLATKTPRSTHDRN